MDPAMRTIRLLEDKVEARLATAIRILCGGNELGLGEHYAEAYEAIHLLTSRSKPLMLVASIPTVTGWLSVGMYLSLRAPSRDSCSVLGSWQLVTAPWK